MNIQETITCRLYIPAKYYTELNDQGKEMFTKAIDSSLYFTDFSAGFDGGSFYDYITAFCEISLIMLNDKYNITEDTALHSELFKLGKTDKTFSLLITIKYPGSEGEYHDFLSFNKLEESEKYFSFELLGDQTMFAMK